MSETREERQIRIKKNLMVGLAMTMVVSVIMLPSIPVVSSLREFVRWCGIAVGSGVIMTVGLLWMDARRRFERGDRCG